MNNEGTKRIECRVRLTAGGVSITSPRTGRTLTVSCESAPPRVRGRIAQARSTGKPTAVFTVDELHAFARVASVPKPKPVPASLWGGWIRRRRRGRRAA